MLAACLVGMIIGVVGEGVARVGRLWVYRHPIHRVLNVALMFGLVMGGLSQLVPHLGATGVFLLALAIGYAYEWVNFAALRWWHFPHDRFLVFRGKQACALSVAVLWGAVPVIDHLLRRVVSAP